MARAFRIDASTLDPRPDTETLVEAALALVDREGLRERPLKLLDLGTGSGCILITLLAELPQASGVGVDVSLPALKRRGIMRMPSASAPARVLSLLIGLRPLRAVSTWWWPTRPICRRPTWPGSPPRCAITTPGPRSMAVLTGFPPIAASRRVSAKPCALADLPCSRSAMTQAEAVSGLLAGAGLAPEEAPWRDLAGRPRVVASAVEG